MQPTWIVVSDSAVARIFSVEAAGKPWNEITALTHPESQLQASEHESDRLVRSYASHGEGNHTMEPQHGRKSTEDVVFARQVAHFLSQHEPEYEQLVLICAPKFLGQIHFQLGKSVQRKVTDELALNLVRHDVGAIRTLVADSILPHVNYSGTGVNPGRTIH